MTIGATYEAVKKLDRWGKGGPQKPRSRSNAEHESTYLDISTKSYHSIAMAHSFITSISEKTQGELLGCR